MSKTTGGEEFEAALRRHLAWLNLEHAAGYKLPLEVQPERLDATKSFFREYDFSNKNLRHALFENAKFAACIFNNANLQGANFRGATTLKGAAALYPQFSTVFAKGANFEKALLQGANFNSANLCQATFEGANLEGADLRDTDLEDTIFRGCNLRGALLGRFNLSKVDLRGADLTGVMTFESAAVLQKATAQK